MKSNLTSQVEPGSLLSDYFKARPFFRYFIIFSLLMVLSVVCKNFDEPHLSPLAEDHHQTATCNIDRHHTCAGNYARMKEIKLRNTLWQNLARQCKLKESPEVCWHPNTDEKVIEDFYKKNNASSNNSLTADPDKHQLGNRWTATATNGSGLSQGDPTTLTWSIVPNGTTFQNDCGVQGESNDPSDLIAYLDVTFGAGPGGSDLTQRPWFIYFEEVFSGWEAISGITYVYEPNDDGAAYATSFYAGVLGTRGDIRIGGHTIDGSFGVLACNFFPDNGDMILDTDDNFFSPGNEQGFKNVLSHEHGHGLGFHHVCPINQTKLMEPFASTSFDGPQEDDILAANRHYGDKHKNNHTPGTAISLGTVNSGNTITESTVSIDNMTKSDFYSFAINAAGLVSVTITPTGSTYLDGPQNSNGTCSAGTFFNAKTQNNLRVELIDKDGSSIIASAGANVAGFAEVICNQSLTAGTYFIRVFGDADQAQMYEVEVEAGTITCPDCQVIINEVDYDQAGNDDAEFIELFNPCGITIDLSTYSLQLVNGGTNSAYETFNLSGSLASGEYFVICTNSANTPNCDLDVSPDTDLIHDGSPDAIALYDGSSLVDVLSYEGNVSGYVEGSGSGLTDNPGESQSGLSRYPNGSDTNENNMDFSSRCITPGEANSADDAFCGIIPDCLSTLYTGGNGADGNMFDITNTGASDLTILSLEVNLDIGTHTVEVYYTTTASTFAGNENNAGAWTMLGSESVTSTGVNSMTEVSIGGLVLAPGTSKGLYVTVTGTNAFNYTNGSSTWTDGTLLIDLDPGVGIVYPFGSSFSPRQWNGSICYTGGGSPATELSVSATDADKEEGQSGSVGFSFTVTRSGDVTGVTSADYIITGSSANPANAADFSGSMPNGMVIFGPNSTIQTITVDVSGDTEFENDEEFTVTLSNASGDVIITTPEANGTIRNDDINCPEIGELVITEIMQNPSAVSDINGEWIEIYNPTSAGIDLQGMTLQDNDDDNHTIAATVWVPAGGYAILGINSNPATNGGMLIDYQYSGFTLDNGADEVLITCNGNIIDQVQYDGGPDFPTPDGKSISLNPNNLSASENDQGLNWCESASSYGIGDLGTPGAINNNWPTWYQDSDNDGFGDQAASTLACNAPPGFVSNNTDCDDDDDTVFPGAPETCDGKDNDCNSQIDEGVQSLFFADSDNDGFGDPTTSTLACNAPAGFVSNNTDCDDDDDSVFPGAAEICDGKDNDCNSQIDEGVQSLFYADSDNDGFGDQAASTLACNAPPGFVSNNTDCDDDDDSVFPGAPETCDGKDNDCNSQIDEGVQSLFYADSDNDGFGDQAASTLACNAPPGFVSNNTDCDDDDDSVFPGAPETCDGKDNDCDGQIDEDGLTTFFADSDNDGFGDPATSTLACNAPAGFVNDNTDCDDNDDTVFPGAPETCDGKDNDCNSQIDEGVQSLFFADSDNDGFGDPTTSTLACNAPAGFVSNNTDCDDDDDSVFPGAAEICDGKDNDCNSQIDEGVQSLFYADSDNDGFGDQAASTLACNAPPGFVSNNTDCDDDDDTVFPGAPEICDGKDNDCNSQIDEGVQSLFFADSDNDGFGDQAASTLACNAPPGFVSNNTDCDDDDDTVFPGAPETCDGKDNDCDGQIDEDGLSAYFTDTDNDGFGDPANSMLACSAPAGFVSDNTDCDDNDDTVFPGAPEACDGKDNNCDGQIDEGAQSTFYADIDNDGFGDPAISTLACSAPAGFVTDNTDCNDSNPNISPEITEVCNGIDDNCNGQIDEGCSCTISGISISNITACKDQGTIDPLDDTFRADVTIHFSNPPNSGTLNLSGDGTASITVSSLAAGTHTFAAVTMSADGSNISLTATFPEDSNCTFTNPNAGVAPFHCSDCPISISNIIITNESCPGTSDGSIAISASGNGPFAYSIDGGNTMSLNGVFTGLAPANYDIVVWVLGVPSCSATSLSTINPAPPNVLKTWYKDLDSDGYSDGLNQLSCSQPNGYYLISDLIASSGDCNDNSPLEFPGQLWWKDIDADGYSDGAFQVTCNRPAGYKTAAELIATTGDCSDDDAAIHPTASETCNGMDDDCDGHIDENAAGGLTYIGNVSFSSQSAIDTWSSCYSVIDGDLTIVGANLQHLDSLINIVEVTGNITIQFSFLEDLEGLDSLKEIGGDLTIFLNSQLTSLHGLEGLEDIGKSLFIYYNFDLFDCCPVHELIMDGKVGGSVIVFFNNTTCNSISSINAACSNNPIAPSPPGQNDLNTSAFQGKDLVIFPNPAENFVHFQIFYPFEEGSLKVYDTQGKLVLKKQLTKNNIEEKISVYNWRPGVYLAHVILDNRLHTKKLIIQ